MSLIVNPLAAVEALQETDDLISGGPVPGRGMRFLQISAAQRPRVHALFKELLQIGLGNLDIDTDLEDDDRQLLVDHGILIDADNVPERPLFSCLLDDVEESPEIPSSLIVNPTFEFQPFDLSKFRSWMQEKHLSPYHATVWVTDPSTGIRFGYWLTTEQVELVKGLEPGAGFSDQMRREITSKLVTAKILIDPENDSSGLRPELPRAAERFARDRYAIVNEVVPPAQLRALQSYYRRYVEQGFMQFGDTQVPRRFAQHGEHVAGMFHFNFTSLMSSIAGTEVTPTYSYSAVYAEGAELVPHVDRDACEFSFSFQIDFLPDLCGGESPWALYLSNKAPEDVDPALDTAVHLANGSCLAYKGREIVHYRTPLPAGQRSTSLFFHYVPA
jgi:hypothetical protein